jgi:hypothetical protein
VSESMPSWRDGCSDGFLVGVHFGGCRTVVGLGLGSANSVGLVLVLSMFASLIVILY